MELSTAIRILASIAEQHGGDVPDYILQDWERKPPAPKKVKGSKKNVLPELSESQIRNQKIVQNFFYGK